MAKFGGDTGIDADYMYEHDQINEVWGIRYCPKCGSRLMSSEFGDASSDESTPGYMCQKDCGYSEMIVSDFLGNNHGYSISGDNKDDEEV